MIRAHFKSGFSIAEVVVGSAIIALVILAATSAYSTYVTYALNNQKNVEASYLLEETLEVATFFRDQNWANISKLSTTTTYYLVYTSSKWATSTSAQYVDGIFLRSFTVGDVKRDGTDKISTSTGTYDPNIKKITTTVSYFQGHSTTTKMLTTYITNIYN